MKKFLSFIFCLFITISYFSAFTLAQDIRLREGEHCYFTLKSHPDVHLSFVEPVAHRSEACGSMRNRNCWFTAHLPYLNKNIEHECEHVLFLAQYKSFESKLSLSAYIDTNKIVAWRYLGTRFQHWTFENTATHNLWRIKNVGTGEYLTYNPPDNRVYGCRLLDSDDQIWQFH